MKIFANTHRPRIQPGARIGKHLAVLLLLCCAAASAAEEVVVPPGDVAALREAIFQANAGTERYLVSVTGTFEFGEGQSLPPIFGDVALIRFNNEAVFRPADDAGPDQLIRVERGGRLVLQGLDIEGFSLSSVPPHEGPLIENRGELLLEGLHFADLRGFATTGGICCDFDTAPVIGNHGRLEIKRTTFLDVDIALDDSGVQSAVLANHAGSAALREVLTATEDVFGSLQIANRGGIVRIINSTLAARGAALLTEDGAITELVNTIIPSLPGELEATDTEGSLACTGPVVSLGHNLVADTSCQLDGPEDIQGVPTGTLPLRLENRSGRLVPVIGLAGASPAVDSADPAFCGDLDVLGTPRDKDGNNDGSRLCDRGAVELVQRRLTDGGINGLYFVPGQDGHYVTVLDTPSNVLVIWNTFDRDGNQAWVYGVGELANGRSVVAEAYTNEGGVMTEMGPTGIDRAIPWGTLILELESCTQGRLLFDSHRPEFGSGEFQFQRLASTRQLGCRD